MTQKYAHLAPGYLKSKAGVVSFGTGGIRGDVTNVFKLAARSQSGNP